MKFTLAREALLKPLQQVTSTLSGRPMQPILNNLLLQISDGTLSLTGTDMEVEMVTRLTLTGDYQAGSTTIPARKLLEICRGLPDAASLTVTLVNHQIQLHSGRSRFSLSTLPAANFPNIDTWHSQVEFSLAQATLKRLIDSTQFSMAHQDVRYHLNGMLFETENQLLRTVATDGHRLAVCAMPLEHPLIAHAAIVPRKGVLELVRLLDGGEMPLRLQIGRNNIRATLHNTIFTCKLVDGRFPDYRLVLPKQHDKVLEANGDALRQAFIRAAILSNEKCRGVRVYLTPGQLKITANNPEQEEAEEILDVDYQHEPLEIGLNVSYILDILNALKCERVRVCLTDATSGITIEDGACNQAIRKQATHKQATYVVMPMRL